MSHDGRSSVTTQSNDLVVEVAPPPILPGLERPDHRVAGLVVVPGGMPLRGGVAAADVPAGQAQAKVHPARALLEALLASVRCSRLRFRAERGNMGAGHPDIMPCG